MLSVIIPTLDAAAELPGTLESLGPARDAGLVHEVLIADGGSVDGSREIGRQAGCRIIGGPPGRGTQLAAAGQAAVGDWLLFLHADTSLGSGWEAAVQDFIALPENAEKAAAFRFALDDDTAAARRLERAVAWRCRWLGLPYGDQGLLLARRFYQSLGGYRPLPMMEDVELVRRIGRRRLVMLDVPAVTSARRWREQGYLRRSLRNLGCLALYFAGLPPERIRRIYG